MKISMFELLEREKYAIDVTNVREYSTYRDSQDPYDYSDLYYGSLHPVRLGALESIGTDTPALYEIPYCSGSDYSGSTVEKSNHDFILEDYGDLPGVWHSYGGHGTYAIIVDLNCQIELEIPALPEDRPDPTEWRYVELAQLIKGLEGYPLASEDHHSNLEIELEREQFEDWLSHDIGRNLEREHDRPGGYSSDTKTSDCVAEFWSDLDFDLQFGVYVNSCQSLELYPEFETGCTMYIRDLEDLSSDIFRLLLEKMNTHTPVI